VTIGNTFQVLCEKNCESEILVWGPSVQDIYGNTVNSIVIRPFRIPIYLYKFKPLKIAKLAFLLNQLIFGIYFLFSLPHKNSKSIIWTREPLTLLPHSLFNKGSQYVIELHHPASKFSQKVIRFLCKRNTVKIIVLSAKSAVYHSKMFSNSSVSVIPMGVPKNFFIKSNIKKSEIFTVGYIGKGESSGNDNMLYEIIYAAKLLQSKMEIQFKFIGLEEEYKAKLYLLIKTLEVELASITFIDHIEHVEIPLELRTFDVGLLPYGDSNYNAERFPIKLLEYAAVGLPIIATDTLVNRELLKADFTQFYSKGDPNDLADAIVKIKKSCEESNAMSEYARRFAVEFTYDERANKLLALIHSAAT
jgi:glycosyltransferase involved in cell wall biosynthesis